MNVGVRVLGVVPNCHTVLPYGFLELAFQLVL